MEIKMNQPELHPAVRIGHVHLRVADLERATAFYRDVLGFAVTAYGPDHGLPGAAFLAAGGYHHHIGLNTWLSEGGEPPPRITGRRSPCTCATPTATASSCTTTGPGRRGSTRRATPSSKPQRSIR